MEYITITFSGGPFEGKKMQVGPGEVLLTLVKNGKRYTYKRTEEDSKIFKLVE